MEAKLDYDMTEQDQIQLFKKQSLGLFGNIMGFKDFQSEKVKSIIDNQIQKNGQIYQKIQKKRGRPKKQLLSDSNRSTIFQTIDDILYIKSRSMKQEECKEFEQNQVYKKRKFWKEEEKLQFEDLISEFEGNLKKVHEKLKTKSLKQIKLRFEQKQSQNEEYNQEFESLFKMRKIQLNNENQVSLQKKQIQNLDEINNLSNDNYQSEFFLKQINDILSGEDEEEESQEKKIDIDFQKESLIINSEIKKQLQEQQNINHQENQFKQNVNDIKPSEIVFLKQESFNSSSPTRRRRLTNNLIVKQRYLEDLSSSSEIDQESQKQTLSKKNSYSNNSVNFESNQEKYNIQVEIN